MRSRAEAVAEARRWTTNRDDMCLYTVQTWLASPWSGPYAYWAWEHAKHRHPDDKNPPAGVPVYWRNPRSKYGHVALSIGGGRVRSTDWPRDTRVGECSIAEMSRAWNIHYAGWAEDIGGQIIPHTTPEVHVPITDADAKKIAREVWALQASTGFQKDGSYNARGKRRVRMATLLAESAAWSARLVNRK